MQEESLAFCEDHWKRWKAAFPNRFACNCTTNELILTGPWLTFRDCSDRFLSKDPLNLRSIVICIFFPITADRTKIGIKLLGWDDCCSMLFLLCRYLSNIYLSHIYIHIIYYYRYINMYMNHYEPGFQEIPGLSGYPTRRNQWRSARCSLPSDKNCRLGEAAPHLQNGPQLDGPLCREPVFCFYHVLTCSNYNKSWKALRQVVSSPIPPCLLWFSVNLTRYPTNSQDFPSPN